MTTTENGQRDELARIIVDELHPGPQDDPMTWPAQVWRLADAIVENIKPRTITTVEELDALPFRAVILDDMERAFQRWNLAGWQKAGPSIAAHEPRLPATVLWEPEAEVAA